MSKHLLLFVFLMATLKALAIDTQVPALHWNLPATLATPPLAPFSLKEGNVWLKTFPQRRDTDKAMPVSIMCRRPMGNQPVQPEAVSIGQGKQQYWTVKRDLSLASVPYITLGFALRAVKRDVRKVNLDINSGFHNKADDYLQYAPLVFTYGLKATGYEGRSQWGRLLASNALSAVIMAGLVNCIKYTTAEKRPDGSTSNSFPSGHTATAFMAATILHKEYGLTRSLWYSVGGFAVATGIGAFRVMNNRHWVSDVMMGAGIGILSTELGYALSDLIFKDKYTLRREKENLNDLSEHPSFFSLQAGMSFMLGNMHIPSLPTETGISSKIKHGPRSVIAAEAAYFINPYLGFGLRARINSTAVKNGDQMSSFDVMGGIYGGLPLSKRTSLGAKMLFGRRHSGNINIYDFLETIEIKGGNSFIFGTGFCFSYALKHNIVWRACLDYDYTRAPYRYDNRRFRLNIHQITPGIAICYGF